MRKTVKPLQTLIGRCGRFADSREWITDRVHWEGGFCEYGDEPSGFKKTVNLYIYLTMYLNVKNCMDKCHAFILTSPAGTAATQLTFTPEGSGSTLRLGTSCPDITSSLCQTFKTHVEVTCEIGQRIVPL
jgi:hypothetical protein